MGVCSRAEMISRGMTLDDAINFEALELIAPSADTQMERYFTRLIREVENVKLAVRYITQYALGREMDLNPRVRSQRDLFPTPFDVVEEYRDTEEIKARQEAALEKIRAGVLESVLASRFFKDNKDAS